MTQTTSIPMQYVAGPQNSALAAICAGASSIASGNTENSTPIDKLGKPTQDSSKFERGDGSTPSEYGSCAEDHTCYTTYGHYILSFWLWAKIIIFAAISFGIAFGLTYWKVQRRDNGIAQYWTYSVFGEVWVGLILASVLPFIAVPVVLGRLAGKRKFSWLKPVRLQYVQQSRIRYVLPTLKSGNRWYSVLLLAVVSTIFAALPLLLVLGLVLEGNTHEMSAITWSCIYAGWVTIIHTISFLVSFAWSIVHIVKPACVLHPAFRGVTIPKAEKQ